MRQGIQTNFPDESIQAYGCYYLALLRWAEILTGKEFNEQDVLAFFEEHKKQGWIEADCFILNPCEILNNIIGEKQFILYSFTNDPPPAPIFPIYLKKPGYGHFILWTPDGTWDGLDPERPAAKDYKVDSYRYIR